ncbi:MAG: AAA family ATPase [Desulfococcaceae bacterium]
MIKKIYINNYKCFNNFEIDISGLQSVLLIGKSGAGKTSISLALELLQKIGRGINRVGQLIGPDDLNKNESEKISRIEVEVSLNDKNYLYSIAFELPEHFKEMRIYEEKLVVDGEFFFSREIAQVNLYRNMSPDQETRFLVDWHLAALPIIQVPSNTSLINEFKNWLAEIVILRPIPQIFSGESSTETKEPLPDCSNIGAWLSGLLSVYPASYSDIDKHLKQFMLDFEDFQNEPTTRTSKNIVVNFSNNKILTKLDFQELSDGEKLFFVYAMVLSANKFYGPLFCFWDEPDHHLSLSMVGSLIRELRRHFHEKGQIIITSHNPEAIRQFSDENSILLYRNSHSEPTRSSLLSQVQSKSKDIINDLLLDEIEL